MRYLRILISRHFLRVRQISFPTKSVLAQGFELFKRALSFGDKNISERLQLGTAVQPIG
jgi:hypothetical protein